MCVEPIDQSSANMHKQPKDVLLELNEIRYRVPKKECTDMKKKLIQERERERKDI
jgi:hypothetical protein